MKAKDLTNRVFGKLSVKERVLENKNRRAMWLCFCSCGSKIIISSNGLLNGGTKSCGCIKNEKVIERSTKHNLVRNPIYRVWQNAKNRCYNQNVKEYKNYGGRGIQMCNEWKNDFMPFYQWSIENGYKENLTIDRINNDGNYEPTNCRYATKETQSTNRRNIVFVTYKNEQKTISEWCRLLNLDFNMVYQRIWRGWSAEKAFVHPPKINKYC